RGIPVTPGYRADADAAGPAEAATNPQQDRTPRAVSMTSRPHDRLPDDARFWRAARYVLGEMSPVEAAEFDAALPGDVELCAAVAPATQLAGGLRPVPAQFVTATPMPSETREQTGWRRGVAAVVVAATALTALFAFLVSGTATDPDAARLVSLWRHAA